MKRRPLPSADYLNSCLDYNPLTGKLIWKLAKMGRKVGHTAGTDSTHRYIIVRVDDIGYMAHRLIYRMMTGVDLGLEEVDHLNGNTKDNRWENIRKADRYKNCFNTRTPKSNKSGIKGVGWHKVQKVWRARISVNGKHVFVGRFLTIEAAAAALREAREELHAEFANHGKGSILLPEPGPSLHTP